MAYNSVMTKFSKKLLVSLLLSLFAVTVFAEPGGPSPGGQNSPPPPPPPKDSINTFKYRGTRAYTVNLPLEIKQIKCQQSDSDSVILEILFNQSINPITVKNKNIFINDEPLSEEIKIVFNKKGDTIKLQLPMNEKAFRLKLTRVRSYDGTWCGAEEKQVQVQINKEL